METKYGQIPDDSFAAYRKSLVDRIWILIPLREENCDTLSVKIGRLNRELTGMISNCGDHDTRILSTIHLLENLISEKDFKSYRTDVFRCCDLISKIGGDADV